MLGTRTWKYLSMQFILLYGRAFQKRRSTSSSQGLFLENCFYLEKLYNRQRHARYVKSDVFNNRWVFLSWSYLTFTNYQELLWKWIWTRQRRNRRNLSYFWSRLSQNWRLRNMRWTSIKSPLDILKSTRRICLQNKRSRELIKSIGSDATTTTIASLKLTFSILLNIKS